MHLDPDECNLDELRCIAHDASRARRNGDGRFNDGRFDNGRSDGCGPFWFDSPFFDRSRQEASEAPRSSQLEHLLAYQSRGEEDGVEKPYLRSLLDKYDVERAVFDWLEFLVFRSGFRRVMDTLRYCQAAGWITPDVEGTLRDYLLGFFADVDKPTGLDADDHPLSLVYVACLSPMV